MLNCLECESSIKCTKCDNSKFLSTDFNSCVGDCMLEDPAKPGIWIDSVNKECKKCID